MLPAEEFAAGRGVQEFVNHPELVDRPATKRRTESVFPQGLVWIDGCENPSAENRRPEQTGAEDHEPYEAHVDLLLFVKQTHRGKSTKEPEKHHEQQRRQPRKEVNAAPTTCTLDGNAVHSVLLSVDYLPGVGTHMLLLRCRVRSGKSRGVPGPPVTWRERMHPFGHWTEQDGYGFRVTPNHPPTQGGGRAALRQLLSAEPSAGPCAARHCPRDKGFRSTGPPSARVPQSRGNSRCGSRERPDPRNSAACTGGLQSRQRRGGR